MRRALLAMLLVAWLPLLSPGGPSPAAAFPPRTAAPPTVSARTAVRPNIVLIMADDMRLSDLSVMPTVKRLLADHGATFDQGIAPNPLCCPARASFLTGQLSQNNGVWTNAGQHGGYAALKDKNNTVARWLHRAGYQTALIGKFLNGFFPFYAPRPAGWDYFDPTAKGVYSYLDYQQWRDGNPAWITTYSTTYVENESTRLIRRFASQGKPFFLWSSYVAPHDSNQTNCQDGMLACWQPPIPATIDADKFSTAMPPAYGTPSYLQQDVSGRPRFLSAMPTNNSDAIVAENRARLRTLQALDRAVAGTVAALSKAGVLGNTLIVFTSDNGYSLGEHRWVGKVLPYEEDVRVPLIMRGPGIPQGIHAPQLATTPDLTATFLDLAGATAERPQDGFSLRPYWVDPASADKQAGTLLQSGGDDFLAPSSDWLYRGYRTSRWTFAQYSKGWVELYDHQRDPLEMTNLATDPAYASVLATMRSLAERAWACSGTNCWHP